MNLLEEHDPAAFPRSHALSRCLEAFSTKVTGSAALADGVLTARVVGEFSAGKTRLLRELFGDLLPEALCPVSSLERQTRLQLELTYGHEPALTLVQRDEDYRPAQTVRAFQHFPQRQEVMDHDPMQYRLRLAVPEPRLILSHGDGFNDDTQPKRLFLIDTPGWNSGDDELAEREASRVLTGYHNLALVYVTQAARLDGGLNAERLREFLDALADADFLEQAKLLVVVTNCPEADRSRFESRARDLVHRLWKELDNDPADLSLDVFCVDFQDMPTATLQQFRDRFWASLLEPLRQPASAGDPWALALRRWPQEWDLRPGLLATEQLFARTRTLLDKALQGEEFLPGMNMYRLMGLNTTEIASKLNTVWQRQLEGDPLTVAAWQAPSLPQGHPLGDWWQTYWQAGVDAALAPVRQFFLQARKAFDGVTPTIKDLQKHLAQALARPHAEALMALDGSFACLVRTAQDLLPEPSQERRIATLLTLSMLQARYEDHYARHAAELSGVLA